MGTSPGRASDWNAEIARLFDIPKRPFSTDIGAAAELLTLLEQRGYPYVARHEEKGWIIEFPRRGRPHWEGDAVGAKGKTMQEAIAKAAIKLGTLLRLEAERGRP